MLIESGINVTRLYEDLSQWHSLTVNINKRTCKNNDTNKCNFIKKEETMVLEETKERKHIQCFFYNPSTLLRQYVTLHDL